MTRTMTLEGQGSDDDVVISLTTQASKSSPHRKVPTWAKKIAMIVAGWSVDNAANGSGCMFIRIGGNAVKGGDQSILLGAAGGVKGTDSPQMIGYADLPVDLDVIGGEQIDVEMEFAGDDLGEHGGSVTLVFA